jgi:hypothetical protein
MGGKFIAHIAVYGKTALSRRQAAFFLLRAQLITELNARFLIAA